MLKDEHLVKNEDQGRRLGPINITFSGMRKKINNIRVLEVCVRKPRYVYVWMKVTHRENNKATNAFTNI